MNPSEFRSALTSYLDERMKHRQVPGAVVGIAHGEEDLVVARGVTSVEHPLEVDETTLFQIGSRTKTFTGTALMRQRELGKLDLDTPLVSYLPEFKLANPDYAGRVTPRHLLTHTGGWLGFYDRDCIFDLDEPEADGSRGKFLRDAEGRIQHLHFGGRLTPRLEGGESLEALLAAASEPTG